MGENEAADDEGGTDSFIFGCSKRYEVNDHGWLSRPRPLIDSLDGVNP